MIYLVTGGSGSGKSAYAEAMVMQSGRGKRYYLATMEVLGEEGKKKVERHKKFREGKGMITIERPRGLWGLVLDKGENTVLLECMANLAANELFADVCAEEVKDMGRNLADGTEAAGACKEAADRAGAAGACKGAADRAEAAGTCKGVADRAEAAAKRMKEGILWLEGQCRLLVVVSSEVFSDGVDYGEETNAYIWLLGEMNRWLAKRAERVVEVVFGISCVLK